MTAQDYITMAECYEHQSEILANKIDKLYEKIKNKELKNIERNNALARYESLQEMRLECNCTAKKLRKQASYISSKNQKISHQKTINN